MEETLSSTKVQVRSGAGVEYRTIAEFISSVDTRTSLPRMAYSEIDRQEAPADFPVAWRADRQWIVERGSELIGHFVVLQVNEQHRYVNVACVFACRATEHEIREGFESFFSILFRTKGIHKVCLFVDPAASFFFTLAQKLCLYLEGTLRRHLSVNGEWYDVALFAQTAEDREEIDQGPVIQGPVKEDRYDWLIRQAEYDNVHLGVVRAILLQMDKQAIRVLLLKNSSEAPFPGVEEPPGGKLEQGESLKDALHRIVKNQVGLSISDDIYYLTSFDFTTDMGQRVREFVFRVKPTSWNVTIAPKEYESYTWMLLQDLPKTRLHPDLIQVLSSYSLTLSYETEGVPLHEHEAAIELVRPLSPQLEETLVVGHHLDAYAAKGLPMIEPMGLILRDSSNRIVGGLTADLAYGCLSFRRIWVDPSWRNSGWGKKLIARAESIARERGCTFAVAAVMDWESLPFFQKLGYIIEGQYTGYQNASRQFRFRKPLLSEESR